MAVQPPALRIPAEIQDIICHNLTFQRKDLLHLSRVCRHWHAVAEAVAWETVDELETLLRLMPRDAWEGASVYTGVMTVTLKRQPTASDWEPVLTKAGYVKTLCLDFVSQDLQWSIVRDPPPRSLFPALRELSIDDSFEHEMFDIESHFMAVLVPPTLSILRITSTYQDVCSDAASILECCCRESITTVHVNNQDYNEQERDIGFEWYTLGDLMDALQLCPRLSHVSLKLRLDKDPRLFIRLSESPALVSMNIDLGGDDRLQGWLEGGAPKYPPSRFSALRHLHIDGGSFFDAMSIIALPAQKAPCRKMEAIYVHAGHEDESGALQLLVEDINKWCDASTLRKVQIERAEWGEEIQEWPLVYEHIEPLTKFRGLTHVRMGGGMDGTRVTDVNCEAMARAWPELKELSVSVVAVHETGTACTLEALVPFARHCPRVQFLHLPLNAISIPEAVQPTASHPAAPRALDDYLKICVSYGAIADPHAVARFLCKLFPHRDLEVAYTSAYMSSGLTMLEEKQRIDQWSTVEALVDPRANQLKELPLDLRPRW
ncbi:hypothetical protein BD626DRAFT_400790 [Schizophyllum amplum]|uniref:F-box domain-containing protein n=1 Tax=Schizophyllum amplum TaxID=97359 RepID=A0A550CIC4_9AGAR|nr:hypothetical protein BD626DRAFT_400790 [Auriculariopsis ampla]